MQDLRPKTRLLTARLNPDKPLILPIGYNREVVIPRNRASAILTFCLG